MVDYRAVYTSEGVERIEITGKEKTDLEAKRKAIADNLPNEKLKDIKLFRLEKLKETDFYALSDVTMSSEMSTYRQALRDIPQDYSEDKYDELLARDDDGNLTHSVWSKP